MRNSRALGRKAWSEISLCKVDFVSTSVFPMNGFCLWIACYNPKFPEPEFPDYRGEGLEHSFYIRSGPYEKVCNF